MAGAKTLHAVAFLQEANKAAYAARPGFMTIAEESTAWPKVSQPVHAGGLGFGFKWNMGFMHDTLEYFAREPIHRRHHHDEITFGLLYAFSENFVLPLSHDEVVHGKGSLLDQDGRRRLAEVRQSARLLRLHVGLSRQEAAVHGAGICPARRMERGARSLDWHELEHAPHKGVRNLVRDLNRAYRDLPALHPRDCEPEGFDWLVVDDRENSVFAWVRNAPGAKTGRRGLQFHAGSARRLQPAAARKRPLARSHQHRCRHLWRLAARATLA